MAVLTWKKTEAGYEATGDLGSVYTAERTSGGKFVLYVGHIKGYAGARTLKDTKAAAQSLEDSEFARPVSDSTVLHSDDSGTLRNHPIPSINDNEDILSGVPSPSVSNVVQSGLTEDDLLCEAAYSAALAEAERSPMPETYHAVVERMSRSIMTTPEDNERLDKLKSEAISLSRFINTGKKMKIQLLM